MAKKTDKPEAKAGAKRKYTRRKPVEKPAQVIEKKKPVAKKKPFDPHRVPNVGHLGKVTLFGQKMANGKYKLSLTLPHGAVDWKKEMTGNQAMLLMLKAKAGSGGRIETPTLPE